ncbi:dynamin family protein [Fredinandcohnia humi]
MIQTEKVHKILTQDELLNRLSYLYEIMSKNEDEENSYKILQLLDKLDKSEYMIGFSGHFSAGKSSMINELIGENLLPSSPIPTSANLVKVKTGKEYARVYYKDGKIIEYPAPYDYSVIKSYCKDGESIQSIEISHDNKQLPKNVTVMDTPGIDSTDDAHRVSTESALHLADLLFYVMDYNHVLSELNFQFTKELTDRNKPLYLIVNQVDKHKESELSFTSFKQGVEEAFENWNVAYSDIFYTTLKDKNHPHNQLQQVRQLLLDKMNHKDELLLDGVYHSAKQIILDHIAFLDDKNALEIEAYKEVVSTLSQEDKEEFSQKIQVLFKQKESLEQMPIAVEAEFVKGIDTILANAILMPFQTRENAKHYVESVQPDFKVGLLFSKNKTEKEREERLLTFFNDVKEKMSTQVEWHLKDFLKNFVTSSNLTRYLSNTDEVTIEFTPNDLQNLVKPGARVTGEYILTYTDDVSGYIKKKYKQLAVSLLHGIIDKLKINVAQEAEKINNELQQYLSYKEAFEKLNEYEEKRKTTLNHFEDIITGKTEVKTTLTLQEIVANVNADKVEISSTEKVLRELQEQLNEYTQGKDIEEHVKPQKDVKGSAEQAILHLEKSNYLIAPITGLSLLAKDMQEKAFRLKNKHYTVALFGAFSAGKSSFANALMGNHVLPVSPNPTTATINKITFPNEQHPHGVVLVKIKSAVQLLDDINHSLYVFGEKAENLSSALEIILSILSNITTIEAKEKPHFSFLKAVIDGYENISSDLDNVLTSNMEGFNEFVANEDKACFVEWIELYYDCPLTRQGITLVDTPGADSINARHTGVAFEYIKNADAILFVTYYNHAFSRADREFLIQLGRVKDAFSMDKMFFLINAADLANTEEELADVKEYVDSQLVSYGIRFPRLYTVSSRAALLEKQNKNSVSERGILPTSGIEQFEKDFQAFVIGELTEVAINEAYIDINRASTILQSYIDSAKEDKDIKRQNLQQANEQHEQIRKVIVSTDEQSSLRVVDQEITELSYYIKQRIFLRMSDMFKEAFNPATLRDDGRDLKKALQSCLDEFLQSVGFDLAQEMRATSLRIETFLKKQLYGHLDLFNENIKLINQNVSISNSVDYYFNSVEFETGLKEEDKSRYKKALTMFKNPKSFFEKNEKKNMLEEFVALLQESVSNYIEENKTILQGLYEKQFSHALNSIQNKALQEIDEYYDGVTKILSENIDITKLEGIQEMLRGFFKERIG